MLASSMQSRALLAASLTLVVAVAGCATSPAPSATLARANVLGEEKGVLAKRRTFADKAQIRSATAIRISPVDFLDGATPQGVTDEQAGYVSAAAAGAFCRTVAKRFTIVDAPGPGVIDVRMTITNLKATNAAAAAAATVLPIRAPIGLGGLSLEGVAVLDDASMPAAAIVWSQQAVPVLGGARISRVGDAYDFASGFGATFGGVLVDNGPAKSAETARRSKSNAQACDRYGKMRLAAKAFEFIGPPLSPAIVATKEQPKDRTK